MDYKTILQIVKEDLSKEGLDCAIQDEKDMQHTKLLVYSGTDSKNRTTLVTVNVQANPGESLQLKQTGQDCVSFQIEASFPFLVDEYSMNDVAQYLNFLNSQVEIPGFFLNYLDGTIVYRYILLSENHHIPKKILTSLIGMAMLFQDLFGQTLEKLAKGQISFVDLMQEIADALSD